MLWCLVLRGISLEFRSHVGDAMWRAFWDVVFAASIWPVMLGSTLDPRWSLTAHNTSVAAYGLRKDPVWWALGFPLVLGYFTLLFRLFRGKAQAAAEGEGY